MSIQPNKKRSIDANIFSAYKTVQEQSEEHLAPEYRQHSHETSKPGEGAGTVGTEPVVVHAVYIEISRKGEPAIVKSEKVTCDDFCPECCLNDFEKTDYTAESIKELFQIAHTNDTIYLEDNDGVNRYIFIRHK